MKGPVELYDIEIDCRIASPLNGSRSNWQADTKRKNRERRAVIEAFEGLEPPSWPMAYVALQRIGPARLDGDNLAAGFKTVRDMLAAWLHVDDGDETRVRWTYHQRVVRVRGPEGRGWRSWCRAVISPQALAKARAEVG